MKKLFITLAVAALSAQAVNAQTVLESKNTDNWYVGVNGGANVPASTFKDLANFHAGLRVGRWITPVVGFAVEGEAMFGNKNDFKGYDETFKALNVSLLGTINFNNWFAGYNGTPRCFEVIGVVGLGAAKNLYASKDYAMTSKFGIDLAFNLGADKQWQLFVEPAIAYNIADDKFNCTEFNINRAIFTASVGLNYKFGNSNGTHNFKIAELRNQAEIDGLNAKINELRADNKAKDGKIAADGRAIADLKAQLAACQARPAQTIIEERIIKEVNATLQPIVIFGQGKTTIDAAGMASCEMVAKYMKNHPESKIKILGYASPEGSKEVNDRIAKQRAEAVKNVLIKKYKIAANRLEAEGQGATDKLSAENDFNRVAKFIDLNNMK